MKVHSEVIMVHVTYTTDDDDSKLDDFVIHRVYTDEEVASALQSGYWRSLVTPPFKSIWLNVVKRLTESLASAAPIVVP